MRKIIYRPHRGGLFESMAEAKEFSSTRQMKQYIVKNWNNRFLERDIVICGPAECDERTGWKNTRYVCVKRMGVENYMDVYGAPQCIGMCATDY